VLACYFCFVFRLKLFWCCFVFSRRWCVHMYNPSSYCFSNLVWQSNELAYFCQQCQVARDCGVCEDCYQKSDHTGHNVSAIVVGAGGCCDWFVYICFTYLLYIILYSIPFLRIFFLVFFCVLDFSSFDIFLLYYSGDEESWDPKGNCTVR
jgi:hypothetical protein